LKDIDKDQANPDVMILPAWSIPHYTKRGMLAKLDSKPDSNLFNGFDESFEYGLPFSNSPRILYLNCDIAEKLHLPSECFNGTFSSFKKHIMNITGKEFFNFDVSSSFPGYITAGGDFDTPEGRMQVPEKVSEAFEFFATLHRAGIYFEEGSLFRGEALLGSPSGFALNFLKESAPFKTRKVPNILTPESITRYIPACICLSAAAGNKPEVIEFADFLASPVIQKLIAKYQFSYPAIRDYAPDNSLDQMKPFSTKSFQVPEYMETVFMPISEKVITDAISVSEAIQELKEKTLLYNDNKIGWVDSF
jgi:ABC-type glycerol-3-phosphate transport system substrate-binding protein